jgi:hypothetical protein
VQARFAGVSSSERRRRIFTALQRHLADGFVAKILQEILINGGFVSAKPEPKDVDVVLGLKRGTTKRLLTRDLGIDPRATFAFLEGRYTAEIDRVPLIHGFPADVGDAKYEYYREFLQKSDRVGEPESKGIIKVSFP